MTRFEGWLADRPNDRSGRLVGWLHEFDWLIGWTIGWLVQLIGWFADRSPPPPKTAGENNGAATRYVFFHRILDAMIKHRHHHATKNHNKHHHQHDYCHPERYRHIKTNAATRYKKNQKAATSLASDTTRSRRGRRKKTATYQYTR